MKVKSIFLMLVLSFGIAQNIHSEPTCADYKLGYFIFLGTTCALLAVNFGTCCSSNIARLWRSCRRQNNQPQPNPPPAADDNAVEAGTNAA